MQAQRAEALNRSDDPTASWTKLSSEEQASIESFHMFYLGLLPAFIGLVGNGVENSLGRAGLSQIATTILEFQDKLREADHWRRLVACMGAVFDQSDGCGTIRQTLHSLGSDDHHERLVLYIALASRRDSIPDEKAMAQAIILTHLGSQAFAPVLHKGLAHWITRTWQVEASERGFRLRTPDLLRRVLREVSSTPDTLSGAARTLLAAEASAGAHFANELRAQLLQLAAYREGP